MQVKPEQLASHLQRGLKPLYVLHGDEPLLALEAGDAIRAAARAAGHTERAIGDGVIATCLVADAARAPDGLRVMHARSLEPRRKLGDDGSPTGRSGRRLRFPGWR